MTVHIKLNEQTPYIKWKHIDGPALISRNGSSYWLTWWDRLLYCIGFTDVKQLERKYWKE